MAQVVTTASALWDEGRFTEARATLERGYHSIQGDVLYAALLERTGDFDRCRRLLQKLDGNRRLTPVDRAQCASTQGRIDWQEGATESAIRRMREAVTFSTDAGDLAGKCWAELWLLRWIADRSGPSVAEAILADTKLDVTRLGDVRVRAALHIFVAQIDAKRGAFRNATLHLTLASELLEEAPNTWLHATVAYTRANLAILESNYRAALPLGRKAVEYAEQSGGVACLRSCLGNLAVALHALGHFDDAVSCLERGIAVLPSAGTDYGAMIDTIARIRLSQGKLDESAQWLDRIHVHTDESADELLYTHRYSLLTRAELLGRQGRYREALERVEETIRLADDARDQFLWNVATLRKAHILQQSGDLDEAARLLDAIAAGLWDQPPELLAQYELRLACVLAAAGDHDAAQSHRSRARTIYEGLQYVPGLLELEDSWNEALNACDATAAAATSTTITHTSTHLGYVTQSLANVLIQGERPDVMVRQIIELCRPPGSIRRAVATVATDGEYQVLASTDPQLAGILDVDRFDTRVKRFPVGSMGAQLVDVWIEPADDLESAATANAIGRILSIVREVRRARVERDEQLGLWPIVNPRDQGGVAVIEGRLRELMSVVRHVAPSNVSVLITGESGTGKEILARAIHTYSDRSDRPFVPFNCSTVPRELVESQLFGHRRGAFTGATDDRPGVIRAATGGTLFLDEIGDMALDLQPKLLRFLESGEIWPVGDNAPLTVDVRITAATNADLDRAVEEGRFRKDLFYRLNVVRLRIPPLRERRDEIPAMVNDFLARASREYSKGRVRLADSAMERLILFSWPGNVRQLQNEVRRMVALAKANSTLTRQALSPEIAGADKTYAPPAATPTSGGLTQTVERVERDMIRTALREHGGNLESAAKALGISRKGLYLKRRRLGI